VFADFLCSRRGLEHFTLIAGVFCLGVGLVELGRYEGYERRGTVVHAAVANQVVLEIPRIGLREAVLEGDSREHLALGVAHLSDTAALGSRVGNAVIAGHRDLSFRGLGELRRGDAIFVRGRWPFEYKVRRTHIVQANDTSVLADDNDRGTLTLITCYPFHYVGSAPQRFVVEAELAAEAQER
jgi:sortase A